MKMAKSVTNETKTKFESLLKIALKKNNSKSTQNLLEGEDTISEEVLCNRNDGVEIQEDVVSKNFIMDRFLNDDEVKENEADNFIKPPVPKPRKKLQQQSSQSSNDTHSAKSVNKVLHPINKNNNNDNTSNETYDVPARTSRKNSNSSGSSNKTYNIDKIAVADILNHNKHTKASVAKTNPETASRFFSKSRQLSQHEIELANFHESPRKVQTIEDILNETDTKCADSASSTKITFEDEVKGKKKKKRKESTIEVAEDSAYQYETILNIIVHNTDKLELNSCIIHPVVKVYLVDFETGEFIRKSDISRNAVFYMENRSLTYILPVITQNFNLQEKRQLKPEWEESIIINEDFNYIAHPDTKAMLFFELLDFVGFSEACSQSSVYSRGWHKIAWAFLKIIAADGTTNTGKKLRLQLYKPGRPGKHACPVFDWWRGKRIRYPSTLYVTIRGITSPDDVVETFRSKTPLEREISISAANEDSKNPEEHRLVKKEKVKIKTFLSALDSDVCKLPNNPYTDVESGEEGCFVVKFSNTGKFLACAVLKDEDYYLVLYTIPDFETLYKLPSHQELIYNISFSKDDSLVASSSSDGTVCIWNLQKWTFVQILPHPAFVYWCEISSDYTIATACYDKVVRIWINNSSKTKNEYILGDELEGHPGYVTCVCFNLVSDILYSSDSTGVIIIWKKCEENWSHVKTISLPELKSTIINQIVLHRKERKIIVHARDSIIRIVDVKNECSIHWLEGALNNRVRTVCCITPCGSYIISGSDNGILHVWNADTGKYVVNYHPYSNQFVKSAAIHSVDFSSVGNLMAFAHFGHAIPIFVYSHDSKKCSDTVSIIKEEKRWKNTVQIVKALKDMDNIEEKQDDEKEVDLKNILEKIDRIIA